MSTADYIGIYAAIVSSILVLWEVYKHWSDKRSKMLVSGSFRQQALVFGTGRMGDFERYFWIEVTNRGNYSRMINKPGFECANIVSDNGKYFWFLDMHDKNKYPHPLAPGEVYTYQVHADSFDELKIKGAKRIRIYVTDTHGKEYLSKWIKI